MMLGVPWTIINSETRMESGILDDEKTVEREDGTREEEFAARHNADELVGDRLMTLLIAEERHLLRAFPA